MNTNASRKPAELAGTPSHLLRRCNQYFGDLYAQESGDRGPTRQQYVLLAALDRNDGASQTALVEATGIDRSTLAEMVRRLLARGLLSRSRTSTDARANEITITQTGRRALRNARLAAERAERSLLDPLPPAERSRFVRSLAAIAAAADETGAAGTDRNYKKLSARQTSGARRV